MRQSGTTIIANIFTLPRRPQCAPVHSEVPLATIQSLLQPGNYPPEFDEATKEILQECVLIRLQVTKNSVSTMITPIRSPHKDWVKLDLGNIIV